MSEKSNTYCLYVKNLFGSLPFPISKLDEDYSDNPDKYGHLFTFDIEDDQDEGWLSGIIVLDYGMQPCDAHGKVFNNRIDADNHLRSQIEKEDDYTSNLNLGGIHSLGDPDSGREIITILIHIDLNDVKVDPVTVESVTGLEGIVVEDSIDKIFGYAHFDLLKKRWNCWFGSLEYLIGVSDICHLTDDMLVEKDFINDCSDGSIFFLLNDDLDPISYVKEIWLEYDNQIKTGRSLPKSYMNGKYDAMIGRRIILRDVSSVYGNLTPLKFEV